MGRVGRALALHELSERTRDRWVLVISVVFALLASAVSLYGRKAEGNAAALTGPSLVTLVSLLVPLVALVLSHDAIVGERERNTLGLLLSMPVRRTEVVMAKFLGRGLALGLSIGVGLGIAVALADPAERAVLTELLGPTVLLGLAFLSIGMLLSSIASRQITAASMVVVVWFLFVFFYDLALLALLIATDGSVSQQTIADLVVLNPAGLYRVEMMSRMSGPEVLESLGMTAQLPSPLAAAALWAGWILVPVALSGGLLAVKKVLR